MKYAHTNIVTRDWRKLADFYVNVFGCTEKPPRRSLSGPWLDQTTGLSGARLEGVHLLLPGYGDDRPTLEIFSYRDMHISEARMADHTGFTHIASAVDDVRRTLQAVMQNGGSMLGRVTEREVAGVGLLTFVYFRDPEGNIVEIQSWRG